jgi:NDP-sugar pyrophosphorylase family protein
LQLAYSFEQTPLGTGGALRNARNLVSGHDVLALNGDSFCDVDLEALVAIHQKSAAAVTLSVLYRADRKQAGAIEVDESGRVVSFESRPSAATPGLINAGVYALRRDVLDEIPADRKVSLEEEVLPSLVERSQLFAYRVDGRFIDIGTPETYNASTDFFDPTRIE